MADAAHASPHGSARTAHRASPSRVGTAATWDVRKTGRIRDERHVLLAMSTFSIGGGRYVPDFRPHAELEVSCVEAGAGVYLVEGREYPMAPGDVFLFNNIERHAIRWADPSATLVNRVVMFDPRFIWTNAATLFDARYLSIFFRRGPGFSHRIEASEPAAQAIRALLSDMEREFAERAVDHELMLKVRLLDILVRLNRHCPAAPPEPGTPAPGARAQDLRTLGSALDFLDAHLADPIRLQDIADAAHLNASYFSTFFKRHLGVGPMEYLARRRVSRAVELLRGTNLPVLEIAFRVGFRNSTTFNDAFRRIHGLTPTEVRRGRDAAPTETERGP